MPQNCIWNSLKKNEQNIQRGDINLWLSFYSGDPGPDNKAPLILYPLTFFLLSFLASASAATTAALC
jgi:hypothetical protein